MVTEIFEGDGWTDGYFHLKIMWVRNNAYEKKELKH